MVHSQQHLISALGSLSELHHYLIKMNAQNVLFVTGKRSFAACGAQNVVLNFSEGMNYHFFSDFEINPKLEDAIRGAQFAREHNIDMIVAIGGGSVIDMAKLIIALYDDSVSPIDIAKGTKTACDSEIGLIAVPTTAGSGSESTHFAVVYYQGQKFSVAAQHLLPSCVILDGELIKSNHKEMRAFNGLDALAQGIESYWSVGSTQESRQYARDSIPVLVRLLARFVNDQTTDQEIQEIIIAANHAGKAINISKTTAAHAFSYAFTSNYGIPHGQAVWLTLPAIFECHCESEKADLNIESHEVLAQRMDDLRELLNIRPPAIAEQLENFVGSLGISKNLAELGISLSEEKRKIISAVNVQRLNNNPVVLSTKNLEKIFYLTEDL